MCSTIFFIQLFILPLLLKSLPIFLSVLLKSHVKLDIINQVTHSQVQKHCFVDCHVALWDESVQFHSLLGKVGSVLLIQLSAELTAQEKASTFLRFKAVLWRVIRHLSAFFPLCILNHVHFSPLTLIKPWRKKNQMFALRHNYFKRELLAGKIINKRLSF